MNAPPRAQKGTAIATGEKKRALVLIRKARRPVRVSEPPPYAMALDSLLLVALSTRRDGNHVMTIQHWRD